MGHLLVNKVQVTRTLTLPPDREILSAVDPNSKPSGPVGLMVTVISLAPTESGAEIEQLQQAEGSPCAIARGSMLTGVAPDPLLVKTSELEQKRLLALLPRMEVRGGLLKIRSQKDPEDKWKVLRYKTVKKPVAWKALRQGHTGIDKTTKRVQADWFWPGMTSVIRRLVNACEVCQAEQEQTTTRGRSTLAGTLY